MPVQRKVFRIERARAGAQPALPRRAEGAAHREFMTEMQALRELIGPRAERRSRGARARAGADRGGAGLQARARPDLRRGRAHPDEMTALGAERRATSGRARAASLRRSSAAPSRRRSRSCRRPRDRPGRHALSASVKGSHEQGLAHDVQDRVVQISRPAISRTSPASASVMCLRR
jgi:hypothetical protein